MSRMSFSHAVVLIALALVVGACQTSGPVKGPHDPGTLLFADDFQSGMDHWRTELERGGSVIAANGVLDINVPAGATVWFTPRLGGPLMIEYDATALSEGGANDRVSDLNCFWMATDSRSPDDLFAMRRSGAFADYNELRTYYVGLGGNSNTTTRFRRYIGSATTRPLRAEDDLRGSEDLLVANKTQHIQLIAVGRRIAFYREGRKLFEMDDPAAYTEGHFGFRTVKSHLQIRNFRIWRLPAK